MKILPINFLNINSTNYVKLPAFGQSNDNIPKNIPQKDEFVRTTNTLDIGRIKNLGISHFRLIDSNSVRGVTLSNQKHSILTELKESGINTIIDLRQEGGENSKYALACHDNGLNYFNFKVKANMPIFNTNFSSKMSMNERKSAITEFVKQARKFFTIMDDGKVYMACLLGLHRTDLAVTMNYLLNPNEPSTPPTLSHMFFPEETNFTQKYIGLARNMLKNLSPDDKKLLKLPEDFSNIFDARAAKLVLMNSKVKVR